MPDARAFRAPARVNLIGGQVDYHDGIVVSMAIDREVLVTMRPCDDARIVARSAQFDGVVDVAATGADEPTRVVPAWGRPIAALARTLGSAGRAPAGADLDVTSSIPMGAGLSSSAAFEIAVALALGAAAEWTAPVLTLARAAQQAELLALGVPCGLQDQLTSLSGRAGAALRIDCRTFDVEPIPLPEDLAVLVVHSGVERTLEGSAWAQRRTESLEVARGLGLEVLRDARPEQVRDEPRGRHVVSEIERVRAFADALRAGDVDALGPLLLASHASSRDDMDVSIPELDLLVELLVTHGALGARLTGGGFGGCVVALVPADARARAASGTTRDYRARTGREPAAWVVRPAAGAGPSISSS
jgi:galactokinase